MSNCAWCGTGEGICDEHSTAMFALSAAIAATGRYRAGDDEHTQALTTGLQVRSVALARQSPQELLQISGRHLIERSPETWKGW
ncbi:MAG TPA: hypothetical protein VF043_01915 [Ktedonobacteraceae bacterium]